VVTLVPYRVSGRAVGNFSIAIKVLYEPERKKTQLIIVDVTQNSDAEKLGLQSGDEIVKIGGVPVEDMDPTVTKDSPLGKIFLNRVPGDTIDLEVVTRRTKQVTLHAAG
jgi:C-terminal processing protease CtpA/Prc